MHQVDLEACYLGILGLTLLNLFGLALLAVGRLALGGVVGVAHLGGGMRTGEETGSGENQHTGGCKGSHQKNNH